MAVIAQPRRHVYVIGQHGSPDLDAAIDRSIRAGAEVVLLCLGRSLSGAQQELVRRTMRRSDETVFDLEAEWLPSVQGLGSALADDDVVSVFVEGRDRERVDRMLAARRPRRWPG